MQKFPEPAVLPPETTPLPWFEDCDWPMPQSDEFSPSSPLSSLPSSLPPC